MIQTLKKRMDIIIIIPMVAMFAAAAISLMMMPVYRSSTTIMVAAAGPTGGTGIDYNSIQYDRQLVKTYGALAVAQDSLIEIANQMQGISPSELANKITVTPVKDLEFLKISVKDENPKRAAFIANKIVEVLQKKAKLIYGNDYIRVIGSAEVPNEQEKPGIIISTASAGMAGLIIALIISFWLEETSLKKRC